MLQVFKFSSINKLEKGTQSGFAKSYKTGMYDNNKAFFCPYTVI